MNAFHNHWAVVSTKQVVDMNWLIKFNDERIMKRGYRNLTRNEKSKVSINCSVGGLGHSRVESLDLLCLFSTGPATSEVVRSSTLAPAPIASCKAQSTETALFPHVYRKRELSCPLMGRYCPEMVYLSEMLGFSKDPSTEQLRNKSPAEAHT